MSNNRNGASRTGNREKRNAGTGQARRLTLIYLTAGLLWILFSDAAVTALAPTPDFAAVVQLFKGTGFVLITAGVLYPVLRSLLTRLYATQAELEDREQRMRLAIDGSQAGYWHLELDPDDPDLDHARLYISPRIAELAGLSPADAEGLTVSAWRQWVLPEDLPHMERAVQAHFDAEADSYVVEYRLRRDDGSVRWLSSHGRITRDEQGRPLRWAGMDWDVTERREAEEQLGLWAEVFRTTSEAVAIADESVRIVEVNAAFERLTGYSREQALGRGLDLLDSAYHDEAFYAALREQVRRHDHWQGEIWHRRRDGTLHPDWMVINALRNDAGKITHYIVVFSDISNLKESERRIERLARFDELTGLPNRTEFMARLERALAARGEQEKQIAALFMLNLDGFARINQSFGHEAGDRLLRAASERLRRAHPALACVGRLSGDGFAAFAAPLDDSDGINEIANALLGALHEPFFIAGQPVHVGASLGISLAPTDGETARQLQQTADSALTDMKKSGRGSYRYHTADISNRVRESLALEEDLRVALREDQLRLHFQPQVSLQSGEVSGLEALVRWQHPQRGLLQPAAFIPLAERAGLIGAVGAWVLRAAAQEMVSGVLAAYPKLRVAVNLSGVEVESAELAGQVASILEQTGCPGERLELELTETLLMRDPERTARTFARLKRQGVQIAIDDFGTGYSSLSYLQRFPLDRLKIDRAFVADIPERAEGEAIARAIVALARGLGLRVTAEGVETESQLNRLREFGCDEAQGFLFSAAVPAEELDAVLSEISSAWQTSAR